MTTCWKRGEEEKRKKERKQSSMLICYNTVQMKPECYYEYDRWNTACYYATQIKDTMWLQHIWQVNESMLLSMPMKGSMLLYYTDGRQHISYYYAMQMKDSTLLILCHTDEK